MNRKSAGGAYSLLQENVSRETFLLMERYAALLLKWNKSINLIAASTEEELWQRHIEDAWQLAQFLPPASSAPKILDMGSGAGLPGVILCMLGYQVVMVESDMRKCVFIQEALRELGLQAEVKQQRIETLDAGKFDIVTARALAPLSQLITYAMPHLGITGQCLFPKGKQYSIELADARKSWQFTERIHPSQCHPQSVILQLSTIRSVNANVV